MRKIQPTTLRYFYDRLEKLALTIQNPQWTEYRTAFKMPVNSKIVVLSNSNPFINSLLTSQFPGFATLNAQEVKPTSNEDSLQAVADQLHDLSCMNVGALLYNYPNNTQEAYELDLLFDGVNLAVNFQLSDSLKNKIQGQYLKCASCGQVFNKALRLASPVEPEFETYCNSKECQLEETQFETQEQSPNQTLVDYYAERGNLLTVEITEDYLDFSQAEFQQKIESLVHSKVKL